MFGVVPDFLNAALTGMLDNAGDVQPYARDVLGLSQTEIEDLRAKYLT